MINKDNAIKNLKNLSNYYKKYRISSTKGLFTDLVDALNLNESDKSSRYGDFSIEFTDGYGNTLSIRISNHNAVADNYLEKNKNKDFNLSIVIR